MIFKAHISMIKALACSLALLAMTTFSHSSYAVIEQVNFADTQTEKRYKQLISELRCLVCQNQNLADSDAALAKDLRRKTVAMLKAGNTDQEILDFMSDRYGDFVLYKPPFNATTAALWLGPFLILFGVVFALIVHIKRRQEENMLATTRSDSANKRAQIQNLLRETSDLETDGFLASKSKQDN